ncbi:DUF4296 domain-containing protein [Fibrisoma montanum]|uniref:DUF4296 domain-containing protein n=1 Tax=Fibrisoma montanum TaxID=2305895 RepID=A0A418M8V3_9BACT|nr:DUF4296 domain-containing protein [Fibrisoma montanum]RIV22522.1 DUF4296 domain-containing protein [Fibrisoma montanum]
MHQIMLTRIRFFWVFLLAVWIGQACSTTEDTRPKNLIPQERMAEILTEVHLAEARVGRLGITTTDSSNIVYRRLEKGILKKYQVDTSAYTRSYVYYSSHPDKMEAIYKQVVDNLKEKIDSTSKTRL